MPDPPPQKRGLQWKRISDFTPGIWDSTGLASQPYRAAGALANYPEGSADPYATYNCIGRPTGGLAPLPAMTGTWNWQADSLPATTIYIVGLLVHGQMLNGLTEAFVAIEYDTGSGSTAHVFDSYSFNVVVGTNTSSYYNRIYYNTAVTQGTNVFGSPYPFMTRAAPSQSTATVTPGNPCIVFYANPACNTQGPGQGATLVYPDPQAPTLFVPYNNSGAYGGGQIFGHQDRIVQLSYTQNFSWPPLYPESSNIFFTNEEFNYSDPPNSLAALAGETFFAVEEPYGYGAVGSMSAGELFVIKRRGGAIYVSGDLVSPTVSYFSGVQPTGDFYGRAGAGTTGLFYGSLGQGAWVWNGGNTSQKISRQLDDNFFLIEGASGLTAGQGVATNYGFFFEPVGDKVYCSNNWLYDTSTGGWWTYFPRPAQDPTHTGYYLFWYNMVDGQVAYAAPLFFRGTGDTTWLMEFDETIPASYWSWKSNPIRVSENRLVDAREIVCRFSAIGQPLTCSAVIQVMNGATVLGQVTVAPGGITATPVDIRLPIGPGETNTTNPYAVQDLTIQIYASNSGTGAPAPILHWIDIGYRERAHIPTTGTAN